jgi:signal transduction histidine kinase
MDGAAEPVAETPSRLLIVDDVADNRAILGRRFQKRGFEVTEADSGAAALEAIEREVFDVVLLDVMMPDIDGLEVLRRIRAGKSSPDVPVIMVTGRTESQDVVNALSLGANDYIAKPVDFAVALLRVSTQAERRRARAALERANEELERRIAERTAELVQTNGQLRAAMAEAEAANRAKDEFLVIVSHELRTPLNGMVAMGRMLAATELDSRQQRMTGIINSSADQLQSVVTDLLDTLDLTSGGLRLTPAPAPLAALIQEAAQDAIAKGADKGLPVRLEIPEHAERPVMVDGPRLKQVVAKLLDNAVKFTESGEVVLTLSRSGADPQRAIVQVRDTGVGFDQAVADRLFRPFEQADGSLTRRFGGVGLGLAICKGVVDLMGGSISAQGRPGEGAVFTVELPLPAAAQLAA